MEDKIFLLLRVTFKTTSKDKQEAIKEFQDKTIINMSSTKKVKVQTVEVIQLKNKTH